MASRRDLLLQQLGITQWVLRRPTALHGEIAVSVSGSTRLLIVSAEPISPDDILLCDVLKALMLSPEQAVILTPDQYAMLRDSEKYHVWWLGETPTTERDGVTLHSPALSALYHNSGAKRALWQQICHDEQHFFPQG